MGTQSASSHHSAGFAGPEPGHHKHLPGTPPPRRLRQDRDPGKSTLSSADGSKREAGGEKRFECACEYLVTTHSRRERPQCDQRTQHFVNRNASDPPDKAIILLQSCYYPILQVGRAGLLVPALPACHPWDRQRGGFWGGACRAGTADRGGILLCIFVLLWVPWKDTLGYGFM